MKKALILIVFWVSLMCPVARGQTTNSFYNEKEMTVELAPTLTVPPFTSKVHNYQIGWSLQNTFWQTKNTGTSIELGSYNYKEQDYGPIDHIAIGEMIRMVPFPTTSLFGFNRLAMGLETRAETSFVTGSKNLGLGPFVDYQITAKTRIEIDYQQFYRTNPKTDSGTLRIGIIWLWH